jgi:hypothetical protein
VTGGLGDPGVARGIEAPFEHRAIDDESARKLTGLGALRLGAGVDHEGATRPRGPRLGGGVAPDARARLGE